MFPGKINIYCKSTACTGADSGARILQETVYVWAVLGTNSKFPEAEYEELVLRVGTKRLASPAERRLCRARKGVTKTIAGSLGSWL